MINKIYAWYAHLQKIKAAMLAPVWFFRLNEACYSTTFRLRLLKMAGGLVLVGALVCSYGWLSSLLLIHWETKANLTLSGINFSGHYLQWHHQRQTPVLFDRQGRFLGLFPHSLELRGSALRDTVYRTSPIQNPPELWWKMVIAIEDKHYGQWYYVHGVDLSLFAKLLAGRLHSGGSTVTMQLIKSMQADTDQKGFHKLVRKIRDLLHAPALYYYLTHHDAHALARWYAIHIPLMASQSRGLTAASYAVFNRAPDQLSLAQQAVLAAAAKRHIDYKRHHRGIRKAIKARAIFALRQIRQNHLISQAVFEQARNEVMHMHEQIAIEHDGLTACLQQRSRFRLRHANLNMEYRAAQLARSELIEAREELIDHLGLPWKQQVSRIQLTIDTKKNCTLKQRIEGIAASAIIRKIGHTPFIDLAVANQRGEMIAYYSNSYLPQYHGFDHAHPDMPYKPKYEQRKIGSIGKVITSVIAGLEGDTRNTLYFMAPRNKIIGRGVGHRLIPFENFNGYTGGTNRDNLKSKAWIHAIDAFAQSNNLAMMDRMSRSSHIGRLPKMVTDFGFQHQQGGSERMRNKHLIIDIPMGNIYGSGRTIHTMMRAVSMHINHQAIRGDCQPTIIRTLGWRNKGAAQRWNQDKSGMNICRQTKKYFRNAHTRAFVKHVLSAVVSCAHHGTASKALDAWTPAHERDMIWHIAKTGTTSTEARTGRVKPGTFLAMVTGAFDVKNKVYSYYMQVGPGQNHTDIGTRLYGGHIAALLQPLLARITHAHPHQRSCTQHGK